MRCRRRAFGQLGKSVFLLLVVSFIFAGSGLVASAATVTTDKLDYPPGDTVWITGSSFAARESVEVVVEHANPAIIGGEGHDPWKLKANNSGNFTTYWVIPYDDNVGETLRVEATGLSSGLYATTTFTDVNTILTLTSVLVDTLCPGDSVQICANLKQNCGGDPDAPLVGRPLIFFFNPGNCGVDVGQNGQDTVLTDSLGNACGALIVPNTPGNYTIRVKFLGESKPDPCPTPGNSACDPFDPNSNKRCVELSNSNVCEPVVVDSAACCDQNAKPVVTGPANKNVFICSLPASITVKPFTFSDPDNNIQSKTTNKGTLSGDSVVYTATTAGPDTIIVCATDSCGSTDCDTVIVTKTINSPPSVSGPADKLVTACSLPVNNCVGPFVFSDANNNIQSKTSNKGTLSGDSVCYLSNSTSPDTIIVTVTDSCGAVDKDTVIVTKKIDTAPQFIICPTGPDPLLCPGDSVCVWVHAVDADGENICITQTTSAPGSFVGGTGPGGNSLCGDSSAFGYFCLIPDTTGTYCIRLVVTDGCGKQDTCDFCIEVHMNTPPNVVAVDGVLNLCAPDTLRIPVCGTDTDPFDTLTLTKTSGGGTFPGKTGISPVCDTLKQYITAAGTYTYIFKVTDLCGATDYDTALWVVGFDAQAPVITAPDGTLNLCGPDSLKFQVCGTDSDAGDTITVMKTSGPGTFPTKSGVSPVCDTLRDHITAAGTYTYIFKVTDECGKIDYDTGVWVVTFDNPPTVTAKDTTLALCAPDTVRIPVCATDPDAGDTLTLIKTSGGGIFAGKTGPPPFCDTLKFYATAVGTSTFIFKVADECGATDFDTATITVIKINQPPTVTASDSTKKLCAPGNISFVVCASDPDAGDTITLEKTSGIGTFCTKTGVTPQCCTLTASIPSSGTYTWIFKVTNSCGAVDYDTATWTITVNNPPVVSGPPDRNLTVCNLPLNIGVGPFTFADPDSNIKIKTTNKGNLTGNFVFYTATTAGIDTIIVCVTDSCDAVDCDTVIVTKTLNTPPTVMAPDSTKSYCAPDTVRFTVTATDSTPGDTLTLVKISGPGTFPTVVGVSPLSGELKHYVNTPGVYAYVFQVLDRCNVSDYDTAIWTITKVNQPPVVTAPDSTKSVCGPVNISFTVCANDPDSGDTITLEKVSGIGTFCAKTGVTPQCCTLSTTINSPGTYTWIFKVTNSCGATDFDTATWTINFSGQPPVMTAGSDQNRSVCQGDTICLTVQASHPTNTPVKIDKISGPGNSCSPNFVVNPSCQVCFTPASAGQYCFIFRATEQNCNLTDEDTVCVNVDFGGGPTVSSPDTVRVCPGDTANFTVNGDAQQGGQVCLKKVSGPGNFPTLCGNAPVSGEFEYIVPAEACETVVFACSSACGIDYDTTIVCGDSTRCQVCIYVKIGCVEGDPGQTVTVPVFVQNNVEIGGFDLVIEFFNTDFTVISIQRGDAIDDTNNTGKFNWHYFTYRLDPSTVIHKYKIHLVGLGKLYSSYPGICLDTNVAFVELAKIRVVLANNELLRCFQTPVFFEWDSFTCLENTFSDCSGNVLYVSNNTSQFDPDSCPAVDKNRDIFTCVVFENGCVQFRCPHDVDPIVIGDINVNGQPYEIADAVLFSSYFIYGESVFSSDYDTRQAQIGATDVNRDGFTLSIADLVYLLRIITGDQAPLGEGTSLTTGLNNLASFDGKILELTAQKAMGAVLFVFDGEGVVTSLVRDLTVISNSAQGQTKVLVYGLGKNAVIQAGTTELFSVRGNVDLVKVEAADYYASPVDVQIVSSAGTKPTSYSLSQNYPNPFNATTTISFSLPADGELSLKVYNLTGQMVKTYDEIMTAGYRTITWDGTNDRGEKVASGIYFYRLDAAGFTDIKKMTLLK